MLFISREKTFSQMFPWNWASPDFLILHFSQFSSFTCSIAKPCLTLCCSQGQQHTRLPVLHYLPELAQAHVHWVGDDIQTSLSLSPPSPALNISQHQGLFQWVSCSLEKAMATHSSTLAWKIPWTEEPGRLQSMGSLSVGHDSVTSLSLFTFLHWRRKWQPTPVFLPGESQGWGSLVGCRLWGCTQLDTTEAT